MFGKPKSISVDGKKLKARDYMWESLAESFPATKGEKELFKLQNKL